MYAEQTPEGAEKIIATTQTALEDVGDQTKVHSLKEFSIDHFRPPPKRTLSRTLSKSGFKKKGDEMWNYTRVRLLNKYNLHSIRGQTCCYIHITTGSFSSPGSYQAAIAEEALDTS